MAAQSHQIIRIVYFILLIAFAIFAQTEAFFQPQTLKSITPITRHSTLRQWSTERRINQFENIDNKKLSSRKWVNLFLCQYRPSPLIKTASSFLLSFFLFSKSVFAKSKIFGWDLYGRVPYDDFLFSNKNLLDPDLFKRSIVEAVMDEIPDAYNSFRRTAMIEEVIGGSKIAVKVVLFTLILGFLIKFRPQQSKNLKDRFNQIRGFDTPLSAKLKKKK